MNLPSTASPSDRLSLILRFLIAAVMGREPWLRHPLVSAICQRLCHISSRFAALAVRVREGTLRPGRPRAASSVVRTARAAPDPLLPTLPRGFAWLLKLVPDSVNYGTQLVHLLSDPEMMVLVSSSPGFGRMLRPLCRMLGVSPLPDVLKPPPPKRRVARTRPTEAVAVAVTPEPPMRPIYPKTRVVGGVEVYARRSRGGFSSA